jgi:alpha-tubulin suppressor-like RCC1 family protein
MGSNTFGKLGLSLSIEACSTPKLVEGLMGVAFAKASCGWNHTAAVSKDGSCYTWGQSEFGQLGRLDISDPAPKMVSEFSMQNVKITDVSCGGKHTIFLSGKCLIQLTTSFWRGYGLWTQ